MNTVKDVEQQRIDEDIWALHVSSDSICGFNPKSKEVFVIKKTLHSGLSDSDAYVYNLITKSWTTGRGVFYAGLGKEMTNISNQGITGNLCYISQGNSGEANDDIGVIS